MKEDKHSIEEMTMDGFRIMRNGDCKTAKQLRAALRSTFVGESEDQINEVMLKLADIARRMT